MTSQEGRPEMEDESLFRQGWAEGLRYVVAVFGVGMDPLAILFLESNAARIDAEQAALAAVVVSSPATPNGQEERSFCGVTVAGIGGQLICNEPPHLPELAHKDASGAVFVTPPAPASLPGEGERPASWLGEPHGHLYPLHCGECWDRDKSWRAAPAPASPAETGGHDAVAFRDTNTHMYGWRCPCGAEMGGFGSTGDAQRVADLHAPASPAETAQPKENEMPATPMTARESLAVYRHAHSQDVDPSTDYLARAIEEILERLDALESKP